MSNTKRKGNKAEAVILASFVKLEIPVSIPFGDNEKYDLIVEIDNQLKTVQIKYGTLSNGVVKCDARHRIGSDRIEYETYKDKVDYLAIWCETIDKVYLVPAKDIGTHLYLRIDQPKNNSCISTIKWAKDYELTTTILGS